jgi:membrane-associated phospholipid phosphatase
MTIVNPTVRRNATTAWNWSARVGLHEVAVVVVSFLVYFVIRGAVVDRAHEAVDHARELIRLQGSFGLNREVAMQGWILDRYWAIKVLNGIYFWGHMPVVIAFAAWLYLRNRSTYTLTRNAFLASGAIAVIIYWALPVAPPRLVPEAGLVDTMALYDKVNYNAQQAQAFVNEYAAVPSLHFGWSLLLGAVVAWEGRRNALLVTLGLAWPVAMFFSVVLTGNHFILDAVAGGIVSFAGLGIAWGLERLRARIETRRRMSDPLMNFTFSLSDDGDEITDGAEHHDTYIYGGEMRR